HLKEKNHSKNFWNLVLTFSPDYKEIRRELKKISL
ncbi:MAG: M48 family metallopeptidase, partial [Candidatus Gracilibacteria bacterium]|nr:M48 family metallopeptidase [Candidatus Gracilibacteria bacterium]